MELILTLQCKDQPGIVNAVTSAILACNGNIVENQQFTDPQSQVFVMRTRFDTNQGEAACHRTLLEGLARFEPTVTLRSAGRKKKALVLVTKEDHCLRELLYLHDLNELPIEIPVVMSNHENLRSVAEGHGISFIAFPGLDKSEQERLIFASIEKHDIDFVILARYMQILSQEFCENLAGNIINIHHSFLPGFKGAKPYHQAHARGVKIIGATAHFVTGDLDEGPIIDQDVAPVNHAKSPEELVAIGRDIERRVLAKAVKLFAEDRIFLVGTRTIIFS
jgi:formyltetrahydrofolate deformylase